VDPRRSRELKEGRAPTFDLPPPATRRPLAPAR